MVCTALALVPVLKLAQPADRCRALAGEGDERDIRVLHQGVAGVFAEPVVEHALRQSGVLEDLGPQRRRERGELGGLEYDGVALASAGPSFHDSSMNGVFHGVIRPATPIGLRLT